MLPWRQSTSTISPNASTAGARAPSPNRVWPPSTPSSAVTESAGVGRDPTMNAASSSSHVEQHRAGRCCRRARRRIPSSWSPAENASRCSPVAIATHRCPSTIPAAKKSTTVSPETGRPRRTGRSGRAPTSSRACSVRRGALTAGIPADGTVSRARDGAMDGGGHATHGSALNARSVPTVDARLRLTLCHVAPSSSASSAGLAAAVFVRLGFWQLARLHEKVRRNAVIAAQQLERAGAVRHAAAGHRLPRTTARPPCTGRFDYDARARARRPDASGLARAWT